MSHCIVGILALQGDFQKHINILQSLGYHPILVRKPEHLQPCSALILPGGESTSMRRQMQFIGLDSAIKEFSKTKPLFGTCAGLILMARSLIPTDQLEDQHPLELLDIVVERNAFGRQNESFKENIQLQFDKETSCEAIFIRAPRIRACKEHVQVLARYQGEPVLVQQGHHLGATFHPELTDTVSVYRHFLKNI